MPQPERIQIELSAYLDGEIDPERAQRVEALLAESSEARRTLESLRRARGAVASLPRHAAPPDLRHHVRRQVERLSLLEGAAVRPRVSALAWRGALAAAAVVVAAVGLWWVSRIRPEGAPFGAPAVARKPPAPPVAPAQPGPPPAPERPVQGIAEPLGDETLARIGPTAPVPIPDKAKPAKPRSNAAAVGVARAPAARDTAALAAAAALQAPAAEPMPAMPRVEVTVQPRDAAQDEAVRRILRWWTRPGVAHPQGPQAESASGGDDSGGITSVSGPSTPMRARGLLQRLREVAPEQVRVTLSFVPRDLDAVRSIVERPDDEPVSRFLSALEAPAFFSGGDMMPETRAEPPETRPASPPDGAILAMQAYAPQAQEPRAPDAGVKNGTVRLAALKRLDAGQAAFFWLQQAPEYARMAGRTVEWTARRLLDELRQELSTVRVDLRVLPPGDVSSEPVQDRE